MAVQSRGSGLDLQRTPRLRLKAPPCPRRTRQFSANGGRKHVLSQKQVLSANRDRGEAIVRAPTIGVSETSATRPSVCGAADGRSDRPAERSLQREGNSASESDARSPERSCR